MIVKLIVLSGSFLFFLSAAPPKVTHQFPAEMKPEVKVEYIKMWEKGKILYDMNCAKCHNTKVKKIDIYPDLTSSQIKGYEIRVQNPQHEMSLLEEAITPEELGLVSTFLIYKASNKIVGKK